MVAGSQTETRLSAICHKLLGDVNKVANVFLDLFPCCFFCAFFQQRSSIMAADAIMIMKGLTKLSKAVLETQAGQLRQVILGGDAVTVAKSLQATAEEQFSSAWGKMQVREVFMCTVQYDIWHFLQVLSVLCRAEEILS